MKLPTDRQFNLLAKNLTQWALVDNTCNNLLETFAFEDDANARLERLNRHGKIEKYEVRSITWKFSTDEMVDAQRTTEAWIDGGADLSPANAKGDAPGAIEKP